jgi:succinoglycan biosynthesis protein ExoO
MSATPEVSIIMANFNGAAFIGEAIASVQDQTIGSWELIVVDDASGDDSVAIVRRIAAADGRVQVLVQPANSGPGAARNRALDAARGRWIGILDSDDAMAPERLERLLARARRSGAKIVADNQFVCSADLRPERLFLSSMASAELRRVDLARFIDSSRLYSPRPDLGFLKPLIDAQTLTRGAVRYEEQTRVGEDFHFLLRLLALGVDIEIEPDALYFYRKHSASISHRLSQDTIADMIAADERFRNSAGGLPPAAHRALKRRMRGLRSWAAYERFVQALRTGRIGPALATAIGRPHAWGLMSRPLRSRFGRVWQAIRMRTGGTGAPQAGHRLQQMGKLG